MFYGAASNSAGEFFVEAQRHGQAVSIRSTVDHPVRFGRSDSSEASHLSATIQYSASI
jgi:hypothetical protein